MDENEIIEGILHFNAKWKDSLKSVYELGSLTITHGHGDLAGEYLFQNSNTEKFGLKLVSFLINSKLDSTKFNFKNFTDRTLVILTAQVLIRRLFELNLLKKEESGSYTVQKDSKKTALVYKYSLNEKGLDTVLKLIEHDDNKERFDIQTNINKHLKRNSNISVGVSVLAFCVAVYGTTLSFKRLSILENSLIDKAKIEQTVPVEKTPAQSKKNNTDANQ